jgi:hypothetical protein
MSSNNHVANFDNFYLFCCPYCQIYITVLKNEINCTIFRCGVYKKSGLPVAPHTSKQDCDLLRSNDLIYGCSRPFKFDGVTVQKCEYI